MNIPSSCDVVIIGGGPGGSTAASTLVKMGYDVVLFEKVRHPRFTVGESLLPHVWKYFDQLGVTDIIENEGFIKKKGGTVLWHGQYRQIFFSDFGYTRPGLHVERDRFDYLLLEHARNLGARVYELVTVKEVKFNQGKTQTVSFESETGASSITCQFVIDASGQSALLSRQMKSRLIDEDFRFVSLWGYYRNSKYIGADGTAYTFDHVRKIPPTTFVCSLSEWGWVWHIPLRESTSVGLTIPLQEFKLAKTGEDELETYFQQVCNSTGCLNRLLEDAQYIDGSLHVIRDYSYLPHKFAAPGYFIVGDAAAFVDPIFSIGVTLALATGRLAAWAVNRSIRNPGKTKTSVDIYSHQFGGWYELARSMALPGKPVGSNHINLASKFLEFQSQSEKDLLYTASMLTTRARNFEAIDSENVVSRLLNKCHDIEGIRF
jgi:flavin-dependent dehydrogenase